MLVVRAMDKGVPELFTDTEVYVTIGDVSSNDGVPKFIRPEVNEVAYVPEVIEAKSQNNILFGIWIWILNGNLTRQNRLMIFTF